VILGGAAFYFYRSIRSEPLDSHTGCPSDGGNSLVTVVIDGSDEIRTRQQAFIRNQLEGVKAEIPVGGRLEVYKLGSDPEQLLEPVVEACNPGRGSDVGPWTHSPKRAEKLWQDAFQSKLQNAFDDLLKPSKEQASAIVESVQSIGIKSYAKPHWRDKPKHLILISDMLQYTPGIISHYERVAPFETFRDSAYYRKVRTNLSGVEVTVFYIPRETRGKIQGPAHLNFWKSYFLDQGARPGSPALFVHVEG
jgi:hypothetical protein